jgi:hypothetical protein
MPIRQPRLIYLDCPCAWDECVEDALVAVCDASGQTLKATCLNHGHALFEALRHAPSEAFGEGHCVACGANRVARLEDGEWYGELCRGHALAYLSRSLAPDAFDAIVEDAGGDPEAVHALHGDYYVDGRAWQPIPLGHERAEDYVRAMTELPGFDDDGEYDFGEADREALGRLMIEGYREVTGLDLDEPVAKMMYSSLVMDEHFRRENCFADNVSGVRPDMVRVAERLYAEVDTQGLVALHGASPNPYSRNARDLVSRLHGERQECSVEIMAVRVVQSFGFRGLDEREIPPAVWVLAERLVAEVAIPMNRHARGASDGPE